jgi:phasin family protein
MAETTTDYTAPIKTAISDFQGKAKAAYEKSTAAFGDANEFAKGNVEAIVESGKILASGLQGIGTTAVAEGRSAFDTLTSEVKELASVKTPTEFLQLQSTLARKNFDSMVAQTSKSTEAMLKLMNDVMAPLSTRVSLAVEKAGKLA